MSDFEFFDSDAENDNYLADDVIIEPSQEEDLVVILSTEDIVTEMEKIISEISPVIPLPTTAIRSLLHRFKWDKVALCENYYMDPAEEKRAKKVSSSDPHSFLCEICLEKVPNAKMTILSECGHGYCNVCWLGYLTVKITDNTAVEFIPCPSIDCSTVVEDPVVFSLIDDEVLRARYKRLITNSFVAFNRLLKWCPGPGCTKAVKVTSAKSQEIKCDCGFQFCFMCLNSWHEPIDCSMLARWLRKAADDSETTNWLIANTKDCPKCNTTIEKNGGCNHMTCKKVECKFEFCWMCLGDWKSHSGSFYECNRFVADAKDVRKSRSALEKYLFYFNRYANHEQSLKFEKDLHAKTRNKMTTFQENDVNWIDVQFLMNALDVLCLCRRTLMYTYVLAFYLEKNNQTQIFEDNQKDLEATTEKLSHYLENEVTPENVLSMKQVIMDTYIYCNGRREALIDHVKEAEEKNLWNRNQD